MLIGGDRELVPGSACRGIAVDMNPEASGGIGLHARRLRRLEPERRLQLERSAVASDRRSVVLERRQRHRAVLGAGDHDAMISGHGEQPVRHRRERAIGSPRRVRRVRGAGNHHRERRVERELGLDRGSANRERRQAFGRAVRRRHRERRRVRAGVHASTSRRRTCNSMVASAKATSSSALRSVGAVWPLRRPAPRAPEQRAPERG